MNEVIRTDNTDVIANACKKIAELENQNHLLGERCNQLLKDKGELTDKVTELKKINRKLYKAKVKDYCKLEQKLEQIEKDLADYQFNYPTIKELKKENEQLRNNGFTVSAMTEQQLKVAIEKGEHLEKQIEQAKEIIKDLSKYVNDCKWYVQNGYGKLQKELVAKAEQFLKE